MKGNLSNAAPEQTLSGERRSRVRMTQLWLKNVKPPKAGRVMYWDTDLPGFGLRVSAHRPGDTHLRATWVVAFRPRAPK